MLRQERIQPELQYEYECGYVLPSSPIAHLNFPIRDSLPDILPAAGRHTKRVKETDGLAKQSADYQLLTAAPIVIQDCVGLRLWWP
jgi:hypothetical protein